MARNKSSDQPEQPSEEQQVDEQQNQPQQEQQEAEFGTHGESATEQDTDATARVEISGDNATLLLAAAEELNLEASVVKVENNQFVVPANVAEKAGVDTIKDEQSEQPSEGE